jgi:hypothetical protein
MNRRHEEASPSGSRKNDYANTGGPRSVKQSGAAVAICEV